MLPLPISLVLMSAAPRAADAGGQVRELRPKTEASDEELVARALEGDRWAAETIYRRYVRYVFGIALRLLRSRADAEDAVQDTFALALERLDSLRDGAALRPWLAQIVVSQVRRRFRRRKMLRLLGLDVAEEDSGLADMADPSQGPEVRAELRDLERVLSTVPEEQRIAWLLRYVDDEALDDVARACACSLATVKRRIAAADVVVRHAVRLGVGKGRSPR